ncbi:MAG TPA: SIS domain-containing protein [Kineosporiaceae bacterium]|nr:SIS domain-containing protein [Kineosporiaceae bacterium]
MTGFGTLTSHLPALRSALGELERHEPVLDGWARQLAEVFRGGGRLLVAGNGGSAAQAQHLTAELVGRFETGRDPLSAIALHAETSSLTAIANDFGAEELFARQVRAHGRPGDVLLLLSTSGRSPNLLRAAERGSCGGLRVWALTGPPPNPLAGTAAAAVAIGCDCPTVVQELHLVVVHALCAEVERRLAAAPVPPSAGRLPALEVR